MSIALSGGIAALIKAVPTLAGEGGGSTAETPKGAGVAAAWSGLKINPDVIGTAAAQR